MSQDLPLSMTDTAFKRIHQLKVEKKNDNLKLRIYIIGGGCAGFQYGFKFVDAPEPDDLTMTFFKPELAEIGVTVVVDHMSMMYFTGSQIDFKVSLKGSQFSIQNPNAQTTCGCGSSFSLNV